MHLQETEVDDTEKSGMDVHAPQSLTEKRENNIESDHDSVFNSDDDYEEQDKHLRKHKTDKFYPLTCKKVSSLYATIIVHTFLDIFLLCSFLIFACFCRGLMRLKTF